MHNKELIKNKLAPIPPAASSLLPILPAIMASTSPLPTCNNWAAINGKPMRSVRTRSALTVDGRKPKTLMYVAPLTRYLTDKAVACMLCKNTTGNHTIHRSTRMAKQFVNTRAV